MVLFSFLVKDGSNEQNQNNNSYEANIDSTLRKQIIVELKNLIKKAETLEEDKDTYCEFMKGMILNTYSVN